MLRSVVAAALLLALAACGTAKEAEGIFYDFSAERVSSLCERLGSPNDTIRIIASRELVEWRREVCQRGRRGPEITGYNPGNCQGGPVIEIQLYCEGQTVPTYVLRGLKRDWE